LDSTHQRQDLNHTLYWKQHSLLKHLRKVKKEAPLMKEPQVVKTHLKDLLILLRMVAV
jgi:ribosomal protein S19